MIINVLEHRHSEKDIKNFFNVLETITRNKDEGYGSVNGKVFFIKLDLIDMEEIEDV